MPHGLLPLAKFSILIRVVIKGEDTYFLGSGLFSPDTKQH